MDKCVKRLGMGITSGKAAKAVENQRARKLYEEIFDEDSPAFVDYYFRVKAAENEIFVVENEKQEILATLHLNPYEMMFCDERVKTNYIVAVSTRDDCRHQGMMRSLLQASLQEMYRREETFTWLMPAAEAIYRPFGFRFIYEKKNNLCFLLFCDIDNRNYLVEVNTEKIKKDQKYVTLSIIMKRRATYKIGKISVVQINSKTQTAALNTLRSNPHLTDISYDGANHFSGNIKTTDDRILCIPFAYSKGWKATDNGQSVKVVKVNGMFCGIVLKPGTHNIKLNYTTPGLKIGACISLISLIILIGIAIRSRKKLLKD